MIAGDCVEEVRAADLDQQILEEGFITMEDHLPPCCKPPES